MKFIIFFFLIIIAISSNSHAQWWVSGGNLIWPYGNVEIAKDLTVNGETNLDSNVSVGGDLAVSGAFTENGVKELNAFIVWNLNSDPTVTEIKNTTGDTFTWDNVSDSGERIDITATSSVFSENKTSNVSIFANSSGANYFIYGSRSSDEVYRLESFTANGGGLQAVPDLPFFIEIKIYP